MYRNIENNETVHQCERSNQQSIKSQKTTEKNKQIIAEYRLQQQTKK